MHQTVRLTGSGSGWVSAELTDIHRWGGHVEAFRARQDAGGLATLADAYIVESAFEVAATPDVLDCPFAAPGEALTASATALSIAQILDPAGPFSKDRPKFVAMNVTATGAYVIYVRVDYRRTP